MYNDYYLQQIDNKMATNNSRLLDILEAQEEIIQNQETIISGENILINNTEKIYNGTILFTLVGTLFIIYYFIMRCFR